MREILGTRGLEPIRSSEFGIRSSEWIRSRPLNALDEIERAHRSVGGTVSGRRHATQQINHADTVRLSTQFQGYCRELHDESATHPVQSTTPASLWETFKGPWSGIEGWMQGTRI